MNYLQYFAYATQIVAIATFIIFLLRIYIPKMGTTRNLQKNFFKDTSSSFRTIIFLLIYIVLFYVLITGEVQNIWSGIIGASIAIFGLILALLGRLTLKKEWQPVTNANEPQNLIHSGVFGFTRHPIYLGRILFYAGTMILSLSPFILILPVYWYALKQNAKSEEATLLTIPGYAEYKKKVFSIF